MDTHFRTVSLISILSLTLFGLTGCGEKRVHVATVSGAPGEEIALEPDKELDQGQSSGIATSIVDESNLSSQMPMGDTASSEEPVSTLDADPINMAHEPTTSSVPETSLSHDILPSLDSELADNALADNTSPFAALADGQAFEAQSSSTAENHLNPSSTNVADSGESMTSQPDNSGTASMSPEITEGALPDTFTGEGLEPVPDTFQIAKAEPSGGIEDQMQRIKTEELAAVAAGLEDVFFQFDSWSLTQEGKQTLERTAKWFTQDASSNLIIEGHTDQRGTQAYNMVLAKKRAVAVQEYLTQLGVETSRLAIISYGKDRPFCQDATEVCHQLNRRGHLLVQNQ